MPDENLFEEISSYSPVDIESTLLYLNAVNKDFGLPKNLFFDLILNEIQNRSKYSTWDLRAGGCKRHPFARMQTLIFDWY